MDKILTFLRLGFLLFHFYQTVSGVLFYELHPLNRAVNSDRTVMFASTFMHAPEIAEAQLGCTTPPTVIAWSHPFILSFSRHFEILGKILFHLRTANNTWKHIAENLLSSERVELKNCTEDDKRKWNKMVPILILIKFNNLVLEKFNRIHHKEREKRYGLILQHILDSGWFLPFKSMYF